MGEFEDLYNELNSKENKIRLNIIDCKYRDREFNVVVVKETFERITNGDILIFNHKTNQYRLFRFMDRNENKIRFKHEDILLNITY